MLDRDISKLEKATMPVGSRNERSSPPSAQKIKGSTGLVGFRSRSGAVRIATTNPALVAQGIEHRFPKPGVPGSNPGEGATRP
jgi:hypothetical protein